MKWLINILKRIFGNKEAHDPPVSVEPSKPSQPSGKRLKINLIRGHGSNDSGAYGYDQNGKLTNEVEYNTPVMEYIKKNVKNHDIECFYGLKSYDTVIKSKARKADIDIQFHCNAAFGTKANNYTSSAKGVEVLVINGDVKSYPLAEKFAKFISDRFPQVPMRRVDKKGKKLIESNDRGNASLLASKANIVILVEPFFIDNRENFIPREEYEKAFVEFIEGL